MSLIQFKIAIGDPLPYSQILPEDFQNGVIIEAWKCKSDNLREKVYDQRIEALMLNASDNLNNIIQQLTFYGYDDGTGHQMSIPLFFTISKVDAVIPAPIFGDNLFNI